MDSRDRSPRRGPDSRGAPRRRVSVRCAGRPQRRRTEARAWRAEYAAAGAGERRAGPPWRSRARRFEAPIPVTVAATSMAVWPHYPKLHAARSVVRAASGLLLFVAVAILVGLALSLCMRGA